MFAKTFGMNHSGEAIDGNSVANIYWVVILQGWTVDTPFKGLFWVVFLTWEKLDSGLSGSLCPQSFERKLILFIVHKYVILKFIFTQKKNPDVFLPF